MSIKCQQRYPFTAILFAVVLSIFAFSSSKVFAQQENATRLSKIQVHFFEGRTEEGMKLADKLIEDEPDYAPAYYIRGRERFKANKIEKSVDDFDKYVKLKPSQSASQWERGIALYYAGKYKAGAKQFEQYQTFHDSDVENSVWRFLCVAKTEGIEAARKNMLEIEGDTRVPMMKIYAMYRGECEPADVIAEAEKGEPSKVELNHRMFYADLYTGLYEEIRNKKEVAEKHLRSAVKHKIDHYMWNVADVHVKRLKSNPDQDE